MNNAGIIAQYGFLYQRNAFVLFLLKYLNTKSVYSFEGKDDLEISPNDKIYFLNDASAICIQVKSGNVSEECFNKIICNWILLESATISKILLLENDFGFDYNSSERIEKIIKYIKTGKDNKKSSVARKVYDKYRIDLESNGGKELENDISEIINAMEKIVLSMDKLNSEITDNFFDNYCADIKTFEMAKYKRLEKFIQSIYDLIDTSIKKKETCKIVFSDIIKIINHISDCINDTRYSIDISAFKKGKKAEAERIVSENTLTEVLQLKLVSEKNEFVIDGIIKELLYKDFRSVFNEYKNVEISNIESIAKANYDSTIFESEGESTPRMVYSKTINKSIDSDLLPKGILYSTGCYIYLTSEEADEDKKISWGDF